MQLGQLFWKNYFIFISIASWQELDAVLINCNIWALKLSRCSFEVAKAKSFGLVGGISVVGAGVAMSILFGASIGYVIIIRWEI